MADIARGDLLKGLRKQRHLTQSDAAHEIGVSDRALREWERGKAIRWGNAQKVAEFYGVDPRTLVEHESEAGEEVVRGVRSNSEKLDEILERLREIEKAIGLNPLGADELLAARAARADALLAAGESPEPPSEPETARPKRASSKSAAAGG
jgi:transcriptional regulator with XRE-family HTH domain